VTRELEPALASGRQWWPDLPDSQIVARLAVSGAATSLADRRTAVHETSGLLREAYPAGYLADLREDWPA